MRCTCCGNEIADGKSVFFLQVFLCAECAKTTKALRDRLRSEVENIIATLDDSLRRVLVEKQLPSHDAHELSSTELLALAMSIHRYARETPVPHAPSPKT